MGFKLPIEELDNALVLKIRNGIQKWSDRFLSLAGHTLIVNQVMLASVWYLGSCTIFSFDALRKTTALVRDYLWSGKTGRRARAKLRWTVTQIPLSKGGIKVIDPGAQTRVLLSKLWFIPG